MLKKMKQSPKFWKPTNLSNNSLWLYACIIICQYITYAHGDAICPDLVLNGSSYLYQGDRATYSINYSDHTSINFKVSGSRNYMTKINGLSIRQLAPSTLSNAELAVFNNAITYFKNNYNDDIEIYFNDLQQDGILQWNNNAVEWSTNATINNNSDFDMNSLICNYGALIIENSRFKFQNVEVLWKTLNSTTSIYCYSSGLSNGLCGAKSVTKNVYNCIYDPGTIVTSKSSPACDATVTLNGLMPQNPETKFTWNVNGGTIKDNWGTGINVSNFSKSGAVIITCTISTPCTSFVRTTTINVVPDKITEVYTNWQDITNTLVGSPDCQGKLQINVTAPYYATYNWQISPIVSSFSDKQLSYNSNNYLENNTLYDASIDYYAQVIMKTSCNSDSKVIKIPARQVPNIPANVRTCGSTVDIVVENSNLISSGSWYTTSGDIQFTTSTSSNSGVKIKILNPNTFVSADVFFNYATVPAPGGVSCYSNNGWGGTDPYNHDFRDLKTTISKQTVVGGTATASWQAGQLGSADILNSLKSNFVLGNGRKLYGLLNTSLLGEYSFDNILNKWVLRGIPLSNTAVLTNTNYPNSEFNSSSLNMGGIGMIGNEILYFANTLSGIKLISYNILSGISSNINSVDGSSMGANNALKYVTPFTTIYLNTIRNGILYTTVDNNLVLSWQGTPGHSSIIADGNNIESYPFLVGDKVYFSKAGKLYSVVFAAGKNANLTLVNNIVSIKPGSKIATDNNGNLLVVNTSGNLVALDKNANPAYSQYLSFSQNGTPTNGLVTKSGDVYGDFVVNTATGTIFYNSSTTKGIKLQTLAGGNVGEILTTTAYGNSVGYRSNMIYSYPNVFYMSGDTYLYNLFFDQGCTPKYYRMGDLDTDNAEINLQLSPNPAQNQLNIAYGNGSLQSLDIEVVSINGTVVLTETINNNSTLSIEGLSNGLYLLLVKSQGKVIGQSKFVKD